MVERTERTVQEWLAEWQATRMCTVLTGHAGNQNAAKLTRAQKQELKAILAQPPSQSGIDAEFWDVPAIRDVVKILFDARYESDSSYQLLLRFCGMSFKRPDPFDKRRDEQAITRRMAEVKTQVKALLDAGWEVYAVDEVRLEHETETRRTWPPKGQRTKLSVDPQSFFGALSLTRKRSNCTRSRGTRTPNRSSAPWTDSNAKTDTEKIAVVPGGARFHHAKMLTGLHEPGQLLERITPIHLPPYAPDHNPVEHVWSTAKNNTATIQHETPEQTFTASASHITGHTFNHDFAHLPPRETETILFHDSHSTHRKFLPPEDRSSRSSGSLTLLPDSPDPEPPHP